MQNHQKYHLVLLKLLTTRFENLAALSLPTAVLFEKQSMLYGIPNILNYIILYTNV